MNAAATVEGFRCLVCGAEVGIATAQPWRCPNATSADRHHVLDIVRRPGPFESVEDQQPLVRFGGELAWQAFALANGMTVDAAHALVHQLDERVAAVAGIGFRTTMFPGAGPRTGSMPRPMSVFSSRTSTPRWISGSEHAIASRPTMTIAHRVGLRSRTGLPFVLRRQVETRRVRVADREP